MEVIALLRGVTPTGKNRIPKMSFLVEILEKVGLKKVKTYIQSGNVILETELSKGETAKLIHDTIVKEIGADLSVIRKEKNQLQIAIEENPFNENYDFSRIHLVFTNDSMGEDEQKNWKIKTLEMKSLLLVLNVYICIFQEMQVPKD